MSLESNIIDHIYAEIMMSADKSEYSFSRYSSAWGRKGSQEYNDKFLSFVQDLRRLAKGSGVSYYEGDYYHFNGKFYVPVSSDMIRAAYDQFLEHYHIVSVMGSDKVFKHYFLETARYYNILNIRNDLVAFSNGVLDLETFQFGKFSKDYHITRCHPFRYDPKADCKKWKSFLHEVLPDKRDRSILQMFLGLGLIQRGSIYGDGDIKANAKVELCLILIGSGANGKSVIYQTMMGIFGASRVSSVDYDELTASGDEGMRARRLLRNAVFNWSSDSNGRTFGKKRSGVFKRIVSGEPVLDRKLGENISQNYNMPYLVFNLNEIPVPDDSSLGFIRRLQFISFDVTIPPERQNRKLASELISEYPGIFNWIVRGAMEIKRRRFVFPTSDGSVRKNLVVKLKVDPIGTWVKVYAVSKEPTRVGEKPIEATSDMMSTWIGSFCEENDEEVPTKRKIGYVMSKNGFRRKHTAYGNVYFLYGVTEIDLSVPINIEKEVLSTDYANEDNSFINFDD